MTLRSCGIEGKQFDLCKCNITFCHIDCFCLQERKKRKMKPEGDSLSNEVSADSFLV